jgi:hypothetical protein
MACDVGPTGDVVSILHTIFTPDNDCLCGGVEVLPGNQPGILLIQRLYHTLEVVQSRPNGLGQSLALLVRKVRSRVLYLIEIAERQVQFGIRDGVITTSD